MSEAKDWAGELISGQTGTGRILVNFLQRSVTIVHIMIRLNRHFIISLIPNLIFKCIYILCLNFLFNPHLIQPA